MIQFSAETREPLAVGGRGCFGGIWGELMDKEMDFFSDLLNQITKPTGRNKMGEWEEGLEIRPDVEMACGIETRSRRCKDRDTETAWVQA